MKVAWYKNKYIVVPAWNILSMRALLPNPLMHCGAGWKILALQAFSARSSRDIEATLNLEGPACAQSIITTYANKYGSEQGIIEGLRTCLTSLFCPSKATLVSRLNSWRQKPVEGGEMPSAAVWSCSK